MMYDDINGNFFYKIRKGIPEDGYFTATCELLSDGPPIKLEATARSAGAAVAFLMRKAAKIYKEEGIEGADYV